MVTNGLPTELRALAEQLPTDLRTATESAVLARWQLARQMGMTFDGARDNYKVLGYDQTVNTEQYRNLYKRGGIAGRCVDLLPKSVWRGDGELVEDQDPDISTLFEETFYELNDRLKFWSTCLRAHILASLSSFSVLLLGAEGSFDQELPKGNPKKLGLPGGLLYLQPFGGGVVNESRSATVNTTTGADATIASWETDARNPRFGQPKTYQLRRTNVDAPELTKPVHWTRVIHIPAEGFLDDAIYGPPALEGVWNHFCDLMKVVGGGSEAFWLRANAGMVMSMDKDMTWPDQPTADSQIAAMKEKADAYAHGLTRWLQVRGVEVTQLGSEVADFKGPSDAIVTLIAGTRGIPKRLLTGSEMGQLASGQDRDNWNDVVRDCRSSYAHPVILRPFIERLIAYGYLPQPVEWMPKWPDVAAMNENEKLLAAETAMKLNDHGEKVITGAEVREMFLGKEPLDPEDMTVEDAQVEQLTAALRKGGVVNILAGGRQATTATPVAAAQTPHVTVNNPAQPAAEAPVIIVNPTPITIESYESYDKDIIYDAAGRAVGLRRVPGGSRQASAPAAVSQTPHVTVNEPYDKDIIYDAAGRAVGLRRVQSETVQ